MKKRIQTIHNKVLVDGPVGDLREHEILVSSEENKVFLQELINGNLETVSEGHVTNLEKLLNSCVKFKKVSNTGESAANAIFSVTGGTVCICETSSTTEERVYIKKYTGTSLTISVPAGATLYFAFDENVTAGEGSITQTDSTRSEFESKI